MRARALTHSHWSIRSISLEPSHTGATHWSTHIGDPPVEPYRENFTLESTLEPYSGSSLRSPTWDPSPHWSHIGIPYWRTRVEPHSESIVKFAMEPTAESKAKSIVDSTAESIKLKFAIDYRRVEHTPSTPLTKGKNKVTKAYTAPIDRFQ